MTMLLSHESRARIGVAIVNWNSGEQVLSCVNSLLSCSSANIIDIVVFDNDSNDRSMDALKDIKEVKKIHSKNNFGFGRGCNLAAKELDNEFILFLNPDACVYKETLNKVLAFMDSPSASSVGICGVQLIDEADLVARSCARLPTAPSFFYHALGISRFKTFRSLGSRMDEWDHENSCVVDQLIGAFFFVRKEVFEALGGFDERFFVYFEEVDFSLRSKKLGWSSFYLATAQAFHAGGGTSNKVKARRLFYSLRSRLLYVFKNFSKTNAFFVLFATMLIEPFSRSFFGLLKLSYSTVKETWGAYALLAEWIVKTRFLRKKDGV